MSSEGYAPKSDPLGRERAGNLLLDQVAMLAAAATDVYFQNHPEHLARWGPKGRAATESDFRYHVRYLREALATARPEIFTSYVDWVRSLLEQRGVNRNALAGALETLRSVLANALPAPASGAADECLRQALAALDQPAADTPSLIDPAQPHAELAQRYIEALFNTDRQTASRLIRDAVNAGVPVREIYLHVFQTAQYEIGRLWQANRIGVAQEHYCTAATQLIMSQIYPMILTAPRNGLRMVAACVEGDLHELGLRMVADFFEMDGWDTVYLGANVPTGGVIQTIAAKRPHLVAISATMAFHLCGVTELIRETRAAGLTMPILVGGYPFNRVADLWRTVGADGSAAGATDAVRVARELIV